MRNLMANRNSFFILILTLFSLNTVANVYRVGTNKSYLNPNALYVANYSQNFLQNGDTIEIDAENYIGKDALAVWSANNLLIKGVGGRPHLIANGEYISGKGIWVLKGSNIIVENIEFSGATVPDKNGAGIRLDGDGLTVRRCYFHDNENGILTNDTYAGDILIEYSEFGNNGAGDGQSHLLYIGHSNKLTFQFNYAHHANIGHNLKSRAKENYILYNRIMDEETGNSSRLIDLPSGGFSIVMGNILMQGENAENINLLGYGLEGLTNTAPHDIYIINNTFVNRKTTNGLFLDIEIGTSIANITNNIFAGVGTEVHDGNSTTFTGNYRDVNIENVAFVNEPNYDYQLTVNSPAIDFGSSVAAVNGNSLTPKKSYVHPTSFVTRSISNGVIDAGAYEYGTGSCPNEIVFNLNDDIFGFESYQANEIVANNTIHSNADVIFEATNRIQFLNGFELELGAELKAHINICGD